MTSWPEEYEPLRAEAREMAAAIITGMAELEGEPAADPQERIRQGRKTLAAFEAASAAGRDEELAGIACRVFEPARPARATYLHFHGGAFMYGSPLLNDGMNAVFCEELGVKVVSADYRLAPEHPFPAGVDDCFAVAHALLRDVDGPLLVGGESAGAYFAVQTLLRCRDELGSTERFAAANLVFGVYDLSGTPTARGARPSAVPDMIEANLYPFINAAYLPGRTPDEARDPAASPLFAALHDLPPAIFSVGSADHLLDDTLFMAARWEAFGNRTELAVYPDCVHGFIGFPMELARRANQRIHAFLDDALLRCVP
jgi:acetyl esterase/lipase